MQAASIKHQRQVGAVFRVRLGEPMAAVAKDLDVTPQTVKRWVEDYKPPAGDVLRDMLAETMVKVMAGDPNGAALNG